MLIPHDVDDNHNEFAHFEIRLLTLSLGVNVDDTVSSSLTESLSPRSRGAEEEELPETWEATAFHFWINIVKYC